MESSLSPQGHASQTTSSYKVWAIADLHLSHGVPDKAMDIFGWIDHANQIATAWRAHVAPQDLVLIPGDISWARTEEQVKPDLDYLAALPGTKVLLKGNHDYWWPSNAKMEKLLPPSIHFIHNTTFAYRDVLVGGSRFWDSPEFNLGYEVEIDMKIYHRELERLRLSLSQMTDYTKKRLCMTHYPPVGLDLKDSAVTQLLDAFQIDLCVFGHIHNMDPTKAVYGNKNGIEYIFTACDYLQFSPKCILAI